MGTRIRAAFSYLDGTIDRKHNLLVQYSYLIFCVTFILVSITSLILVFENVKWLDPLHQLAKNIHSIVQYGLYACMRTYIIGVIRVDLTKYGDIVNCMINANAKK